MQATSSLPRAESSLGVCYGHARERMKSHEDVCKPTQGVRGGALAENAAAELRGTFAFAFAEGGGEIVGAREPQFVRNLLHGPRGVEEEMLGLAQPYILEKAVDRLARGFLERLHQIIFA